MLVIVPVMHRETVLHCWNVTANRNQLCFEWKWGFQVSILSGGLSTIYSQLCKIWIWETHSEGTNFAFLHASNHFFIQLLLLSAPFPKKYPVHCLDKINTTCLMPVWRYSLTPLLHTSMLHAHWMSLQASDLNLLIYLYFFHFHLVPLYLPPPCSLHSVVHVHESFYLLAWSLYLLTSLAPMAVILIAIYESQLRNLNVITSVSEAVSKIYEVFLLT